jgi:hypothetical protein
MQVWHGTPDAPRPRGLRPGEPIELVIGTWPIEPGQEIAVELTVTRPGANAYLAVLSAEWQHNTGPNSYWRAIIGPRAGRAAVSSQCSNCRSTVTSTSGMRSGCRSTA